MRMLSVLTVASVLFITTARPTSACGGHYGCLEANRQPNVAGFYGGYGWSPYAHTPYYGPSYYNSWSPYAYRPYYSHHYRPHYGGYYGGYGGVTIRGRRFAISIGW